jgi:hypothetical protein
VVEAFNKMAQPQRTKCDGELDYYAHKHEATVEYLAAVLDYCRTIGPAVAEKRGAIEVFIQSLVTLLVARHEWFLGMILAAGVRENPDRWQSYLVVQAKPEDRDRVRAYDLRTLIQQAKRTTSLKKRGASFERAFRQIFGFSPWPSEEARQVILDLNLLRQLFVHHNAATLGDDYYSQFSRKQLLNTRKYGGNPSAAHSADYRDCLTFLPEAVMMLEKQRLYFRAEMLIRPEWLIPKADA